MSIWRRLFKKDPSNIGGAQTQPSPEHAVNMSQEGGDYQFKWYAPGPENPFGVRILDCRSLTRNVVSATSDLSIAERYNQLRASDGKDLRSVSIEDSIRCPVSLKFPHNGAQLEGIVFKAPSMDVKWDIYIYDSVFLFARSWTGELQLDGKRMTA